MLLLSMKMCLGFIWVICLLFAVETKAASTPGTSSINVTVEPSENSTQLTTAYVLHIKKEAQPTSGGPSDKPSEVSVAAATAAVSPTAVSNKTHSSGVSTAGVVATSSAAAAAAATSSSYLRLLHSSTAAGEAQPPHSTTITETAKHTEDGFHLQSPTTFADTAAPETTSAAASSPQPTSITEPEITSELPSSTSSDKSTEVPVLIQDLSSPSSSSTTAVTTDSTSEAALGFRTTSFPVAVTETSTSTELSSTSQSTSAASTLISTSHVPDTAGSSSTSTSVSTDSPSTATAVSTSPAGILIPLKPKRLPIQTTKSAPATTAAPHGVSKSTPCSTRGVVKNCLIVIACLAGLATIFMVSTIILCTKLSARKCKMKKPHQETEMMCISALLPDYTYTRQRNRVTNGVLVIPGCGDSDEDGGDNVTLSSFLPENDRFV